MNKIITGILILFFSVSSGFCQTAKPGVTPRSSRTADKTFPLYTVSITERGKERICEQQLDFVLKELGNLSQKHPVLADFDKGVAVQKEFVESENGMYYGVSFTNNFAFSMLPATALDAKRSFVGINFSLRTGKYSGQADMTPLPSGITIFDQVVSDDKALEKEIYGILEEAKRKVMEWEKEKIRQGYLCNSDENCKGIDCSKYDTLDPREEKLVPRCMLGKCKCFSMPDI
ncbi:MAG: hypothetical protein WCI27_00420 [Candidatus Omnitrophota bacterium]